MNLASPQVRRSWLIRNFWLFTLLLNLVLVVVFLIVLALLLS